MKTYPLWKFVHRILVARLGLTAALFAVFVGLISYGVQHWKLEREIADLGRRGMFSLVEKVRFAIEWQKTDVVTALQDVVGRSDPPVVYRAGRFIYVQFYDRKSRVIADYADSKQANLHDVKTFVTNRPFAFPKFGEYEAQMTKIGEGSFIILSAPLVDQSGKAAVFVRGMFAVSPQELSRMRRAIIWSTLIVITIVIAVSALLYPVILRLARNLADYSTHLLDANLETLSVLGSAIAQRDSDTDGHNYRVTLYSTRIGEIIGLADAELRVLIKGSFLHDVGKLGIPDNILLKPGRLDAEEFAIMKRHVEKGVDIVQRSSWLREGTNVVGYHHEKFAGGGYPNNLKGEDIPITARIFAVADVFDALTSLRPYKKPLAFEDTMSILMQDRGKHFDPTVLDAFAKVARELFDRYSGHEGMDLKDELASVLTKYFSSGIDTLHYEARM